MSLLARGMTVPEFEWGGKSIDKAPGVCKRSVGRYRRRSADAGPDVVHDVPRDLADDAHHLHLTSVSTVRPTRPIAIPSLRRPPSSRATDSTIALSITMARRSVARLLAFVLLLAAAAVRALHIVVDVAVVLLRTLCFLVTAIFVLGVVFVYVVRSATRRDPACDSV